MKIQYNRKWNELIKIIWRTKKNPIQYIKHNDTIQKVSEGNRSAERMYLTIR